MVFHCVDFSECPDHGDEPLSTAGKVGRGGNPGVAAPAIEYKKEGQVFGIGSKIFTIAGPVILYGVLTSWVLGLIQYVAERW